MTKKQIVKYWITNKRDELLEIFDSKLSYPENVSQEGEEIDDDEFIYRRALKSCWGCGFCKYPSNSSIIEICHIVPKSMGGSNKADNLVLLCKDCHKSMPSALWVEQNDVLNWLKNREPLFISLAKAVSDALKRNEKDFKEPFEKIEIDFMMKIMKGLMKKIEPHGKSFSPEAVSAVIDKAFSFMRQYKE